MWSGPVQLRACAHSTRAPLLAGWRVKIECAGARRERACVRACVCVRTALEGGVGRQLTVAAVASRGELLASQLRSRGRVAYASALGGQGAGGQHHGYHRQHAARAGELRAGAAGRGPTAAPRTEEAPHPTGLFIEDSALFHKVGPRWRRPLCFGFPRLGKDSGP